MKNFLLDLWNDLRAKRLWPVAVVLLAALVAVPVVLSKGAEEPAVAPPAAQPKAGAGKSDGPARLAEVKLEELGQGTGSSLSSFDDPSNPFAPPRKVLDKIRAEERGETGGGNAGGGGAGGGDASANGGSGGGEESGGG